MNNYTVSKQSANKFTDGVGPMILKFLIGVGLILGVVAFVLVLTRKCKPCGGRGSGDDEGYEGPRRNFLQRPGGGETLQ